MLLLLITLPTYYIPCERNEAVLRGAIFWYENPDPIAIANAFPLYVVVDPDNGPNDAPWKRSDIEMIESEGIVLLAYLNIGFAEQWRDYWDSIKDQPWLIDVKNPWWSGEYFVEYWHESAWGKNGWVETLRREIAKLIAMGFKGILFNNVDNYTYREESRRVWLTHSTN